MNPTEAEKHLRVIRSLMERATIYRAISAPTAFIGGLLSIAACALEFWINLHSTPAHSLDDSPHFLVIWLAVLSLTVIANTFFIWQSAKKRGEPFFSAGMKMAAFCSFPAFLSAFVFTLFIFISFKGDAHASWIFL